MHILKSQLKELYMKSAYAKMRADRAQLAQDAHTPKAGSVLFTQDQVALLRADKERFGLYALKDLIDNAKELKAKGTFKNKDHFTASLHVLSLLGASDGLEPLLTLLRGCPGIGDVLEQNKLLSQIPYLVMLMANGNWQSVFAVVEDEHADPLMRIVCLRACGFIVAHQPTFRDGFIAQLKALLVESLGGDVGPMWCATFVAAVTELWPKECLDAIQELYAANLVDVKIITMDDVLAAIVAGKDACLAEVNNEINFFMNSFIDATPIDNLQH